MLEYLRPDICVIGAGSGGLSVAAAAAAFGVDVVLVERGRMGGDCLNYGCVPSKAMIAAGKRAHAMRTASIFGIEQVDPTIDFSAVHAHVRSVIDAIAPNDSVERFESLGVKVIKAEGRFIDERTLEAGGHRISARRFVIATGSSPVIPPIPGIDSVEALTNETIFDLEHRPDHLVIVGGGPIGLELAQAHRRLGSRVTVVEAAGFLSREDPDLAAIALDALREEGIALLERHSVVRIERTDDGLRLVAKFEDGGERIVGGSHLLVAAGRSPNLAALALDAAKVRHDKKGIAVDAGLRSSNRRIYAIGDVAGGPQFTHVAGYHAGIVIRRALFGLPAKVDYSALPWVTYTDPELAHVGLSEADARLAGEAVTVLTEKLSGNDRARAERVGEGLAKIVLGARGRILGATILAPRAGEMIGLWGLAIQQKMKIGAVAQMMAPYPTMSEISKRAAGGFYTPSLFSARTRFVVRMIQKVLP